MSKINPARRFLRKLERLVGIPLGSTTSTTRRGMGLENVEEVLRASSQGDNDQTTRSAPERIGGFPSSESTARVRRELGL